MAGGRKAAEKRGRRAELIACTLLRLKGYRILAERVRAPVGEIDIIATRGNTLVFVEVKQRRTRAAALESITAKQRSRIERAALLWVAKHKKQHLSLRFDVIAIAWPRLPSHIKDAWRANVQATL
ncbi:YraN family protein [Kordiimonas gwangyangensis]|uniref:YraN family protein n=1 Tax=Kordiimonas gwangyangensis TaxID=288022 RepID=UPI000368863D|nr:YraN family protein [Kordiimonas gwangyangensis]